jgi:cytoskeletal protein CcmA (bactofilin family)
LFLFASVLQRQKKLNENSMALFRKTENAVDSEVVRSSNFIGNGTTVSGNIEASGLIRIDGKILGNINSKSKVYLGKGAKVEGDIIAQNAEIEGEVIGLLKISETLTLKPTAIIKGDIYTDKLVVESGAVFNGMCKMSSENNSQNSNAQPKKEKSPLSPV